MGSHTYSYANYRTILRILQELLIEHNDKLIRCWGLLWWWCWNNRWECRLTSSWSPLSWCSWYSKYHYWDMEFTLIHINTSILSNHRLLHFSYCANCYYGSLWWHSTNGCLCCYRNLGSCRRSGKLSCNNQCCHSRNSSWVLLQGQSWRRKRILDKQEDFHLNLRTIEYYNIGRSS